MRFIFTLLFLISIGLTPAWSAATKNDTSKQETSSEEMYSFSTLPEATDASSEQSMTPPDEIKAQDKKEERAYKFNALIALSFTTVILYLVGLVSIFKLPTQRRGGQIVQLTSLALIIYGALVLSIVPTTQEGLNAPIGILGALAGYLFGHSSAANAMTETRTQKDQVM